MRVQTKVEISEAHLRENLVSETVIVSRKPIGEYVERIPEVRTEGDLTIIPVLEEVLVVEKKLLLKEEIHVRKQATTETITETVPLRRQHAIVTTLSDTTE